MAATPRAAPPAPTSRAARAAAAAACVVAALLAVVFLARTASSSPSPAAGGAATAAAARAGAAVARADARRAAAARLPFLSPAGGRRGAPGTPRGVDAPPFCVAVDAAEWPGAHTLVDDAYGPGTAPWASCGLPEPAASDGSCDAALNHPKVALMFLTRGALPHEALWARWLDAAAGLLPLPCVAAAACGRGGGWAEIEKVKARCRASADRAAQRLFSLYVHAPPSFDGFAPDSPFAGALVKERYFTKAGTRGTVRRA